MLKQAGTSWISFSRDSNIPSISPAVIRLQTHLRSQKTQGRGRYFPCTKLLILPRKGSGGQAAVIDGLSLAAVQIWLRGISKSSQGQIFFRKTWRATSVWIMPVKILWRTGGKFWNGKKNESPVMRINAYLWALLVCSIGESEVVALIKDSSS